MTDATFEQSRDFVQSLARGLAVLRCISANGASATLPEIASRSGLSRAATRRLVLTLEHLGYLRANGREYAFSPAKACVPSTNFIATGTSTFSTSAPY